MHPNPTHLTTNKRQATQNLPAKPFYDIPPEAGGIEYVIEWENAKAKPMQKWFGITREQFPPAEKLTEHQLKMMVKEMLHLWEAYHFYPNLPEDVDPLPPNELLMKYEDLHV